MSIYESKDKEVPASRVTELISDASIAEIEKIFNDYGFKLVDSNFNEQSRLHELFYCYNAGNYKYEAYVRYSEGSPINIQINLIGATLFSSMKCMKEYFYLVNSIKNCSKK